MPSEIFSLFEAGSWKSVGEKYRPCESRSWRRKGLRGGGSEYEVDTVAHTVWRLIIENMYSFCWKERSKHRETGNSR